MLAVSSVRGDASLFPKTQALDQRAITIGASALKIIEQFAPAIYHAQQAATGVVVLDMSLEMSGQLIDAGG